MSARRSLAPALTGCAIVVAGVRHAEPLAAALEKRGAQVTGVPPLTGVQAADSEELLDVTRQLIDDPPDAIVVTSGAGLRGWIDLAHANGLADRLADMFARARFVARGPRAHGAIRQAGFASNLVVDAEAEADTAIAAYLDSQGICGGRIAIQYQGPGVGALDALLHPAGGSIIRVPVSGWGRPADLQVFRRSVVQTVAGEVDAVLFTSASGAGEWIRAAETMRVLEALRRRAAAGRLLLVAGPNSSAMLHGADLRTTTAARGRVGSFVRVVVNHFGSVGTPRLRTVSGAIELRSGGAVIDGRFVPLARSSASILGVLFDAGGHVLSRDELSRALPRGRDNAHAAEMAVARLREALGIPDIVKTVVKRGYRLNVEEQE